jgi:iron(II)-dependent oxidoreductase
MAHIALLADDRQILAARLIEARERTDEVLQALQPELFREPRTRAVAALLQHAGHVEAFDWRLLAGRMRGAESCDPRLEVWFTSEPGVDPGAIAAGPRHDELEEYARRSRENVDDCVLDLRPTCDGSDVATNVHRAIEHRFAHAESLAWELRALPHDAKRPQADPPPPVYSRRAKPGTIDVPGGLVTLGAVRGTRPVGWDHEYAACTLPVPAFTIDSHKVTNGRYLEFVRDGGYAERRLWSREDFEWLRRERITHPATWRPQGEHWLFRGVFGDVPLPVDAPVVVSRAEATAFARWSGRWLPTELQYHRAAYGTEAGEEREYPWGDDAPRAPHGNFAFVRWDVAPIGSYPAGESAFGVSELVGNGWEWTRSIFEPFPGYREDAIPEAASSRRFDGRYFVLKGGSPRTAARLLRRSYRLAQPTRGRGICATFRLVTP